MRSCPACQHRNCRHFLNSSKEKVAFRALLAVLPISRSRTTVQFLECCRSGSIAGGGRGGEKLGDHAGDVHARR